MPTPIPLLTLIVTIVQSTQERMAVEYKTMLKKAREIIQALQKEYLLK
ncbi:MAG TPA: hypothetical protein VGO58_07660 [Chitinophagaceae bacterium]|nr:hypothetical protein [Chitinophagaceae bacterium]